MSCIARRRVKARKSSREESRTTAKVQPKADRFLASYFRVQDPADQQQKMLQLGYLGLLLRLLVCSA